jgi:MoaA/NifB/PqqE/SkfB family radical SAM enzyme
MISKYLTLVYRIVKGSRLVRELGALMKVNYFKLKYPTKRKLLQKIETDMKRGNVVVSYDPVEWFFEISKRCNIRCLTCGRVYDKRFEEHGFMGNMSIQILDQIEAHLDRSLVVHSVGFGEPFMNPAALNFLRTIKKHQPYLDIISNGTLLKGKMEEIVSSGLDSLVVSMDGGNKEVFEYFRSGAKWDEVTDNLDELCKIKQAHRSNKPELWIEFVAMRGNLHTLPALVELAATRWGAKGVSVEPLYQVSMDGYTDFYLQQNLSSMPFQEVDRLFRTAKSIGDRNGLTLTGPYYLGDRETIWRNAWFKPLYYIDYPLSGAVVNGFKDFHGWALHPSGIERVTYRIGTGEVKEAKYGYERLDVYQTMSVNIPYREKSGFVMSVNPSMFEEGENILRVSIYTKDGRKTDIQPVTFSYYPYGTIETEKGNNSTRINLDSPLPHAFVEDSFLLVGWLVPPLPSKLKVYFNDEVQGEATLRIERPDTSELSKKIGFKHPDIDQCGFFFPLNIEQYEDGEYSLRIKGFFEKGLEEEIGIPVILKRDSFRRGKVAEKSVGFIELPSQGEVLRKVIQPVIGWAVYGPEMERIKLLCDGREIEWFCHDISRPDIIEKFSLQGLSDRIGFAVPLDTKSLSQGEHSLTLVAYSRKEPANILHEIKCFMQNNSYCNVIFEKEQSGNKSVICTDDRRPALKGRKTLKEAKKLSYRNQHRKSDLVPFCSLPWTTTYIAFDGTVRACCFTDSITVLGDLTKENFKDIWNGEHYRRIRWEILNGIIPENCKSCMANARIHGRDIFSKFKTFID